MTLTTRVPMQPGPMLLSIENLSHNFSIFLNFFKLWWEGQAQCYKTWVKFTGPCSLDQWIHYFFIRSHSLYLVNSFLIQWNHFVYKDTFCCNEDICDLFLAFVERRMACCWVSQTKLLSFIVLSTPSSKVHTPKEKKRGGSRLPCLHNRCVHHFIQSCFWGYVTRSGSSEGMNGSVPLWQIPKLKPAKVKTKRYSMKFSTQKNHIIKTLKEFIYKHTTDSKNVQSIRRKKRVLLLFCQRVLFCHLLWRGSM